MPRNRSEKGPQVYPLTSRPRLNRYIAFWYQLHWAYPWGREHRSKLTPEQLAKREIYSQQDQGAREALDNLDVKAWMELSLDGRSGVSGDRLRDLYRAAQSK